MDNFYGFLETLGAWILMLILIAIGCMVVFYVGVFLYQTPKELKRIADKLDMLFPEEEEEEDHDGD